MTERTDSTLSRLLPAWQPFWFAEGSTFNLGLFRILLAYCFLREVETTRKLSTFAVEGGFHLPYVWFIAPVSQQTYGWMHDVQYPLIALLAVGLFTRFAAAGLLTVQGYVFFADQLNFRNHPYFLLLLLFLLALSPSDDALSVKAVWNGMRRGRPAGLALLGSTRPLTLQRLMQVQVTIAYLYAGFHKLNPGYLSGRVLGHYLTLREDNILESLMTGHRMLVLLSVSTAVFELVAPVGLWFRRTRLPVMAVGVVFHLLIAVSMNIVTFSIAMIASYLLFLDPETLVARLRPRRARAVMPPAVSRERPAGGVAGARPRGRRKRGHPGRR